MGSSTAPPAVLTLREPSVQEIRCDQLASPARTVDPHAKAFMMCGPNALLKLEWQDNSDHVSFQHEGSEDDRVADYDLKLLKIESEDMNLARIKEALSESLAHPPAVAVSPAPSGEDTQETNATTEGDSASTSTDLRRETEKPSDLSLECSAETATFHSVE